MAKKMVEIGKTELRKMKAKIASAERRENKKKQRKIDGLGPALKQRYKSALREVWQRSSEARKICVRRSALANGYARCEKCKKKVPKIYVDHIIPCGEFDEGYLKRLSVSSAGLQALCKKCHDEKTKIDNKSIIGEFY